jgi:hypothetical protein
MIINVHSMIRHNILTQVQRRKLATRGCVEKNTSAISQVGIERLESYASLKRKNKEKSSIMRILLVLLVASAVWNILLLMWGVHLRDSILWHQSTEHREHVEEVVWDE